MNKKDIISHHKKLLQWAERLHDSVDEVVWFQPFSEGKWGTADVVSHFITWDRFMLEHRIPYIEKGLSFPKIDVNAEKMNKDASVYARSRIQKERLINEYIETRELVLAHIEAFPEALFEKEILIGKKEMKVGEYFYSHIEHDLKHVQQINDFIGLELENVKL